MCCALEVACVGLSVPCGTACLPGVVLATKSAAAWWGGYHAVLCSDRETGSNAGHKHTHTATGTQHKLAHLVCCTHQHAPPPTATQLRTRAPTHLQPPTRTLAPRLGAIAPEVHTAHAACCAEPPTATTGRPQPPPAKPRPPNPDASGRTSFCAWGVHRGG